MTRREKKIVAARCAGNRRRLDELEAQEARRKYIEKIDSKGTGAMPHAPTVEEMQAMGYWPRVLDQGNSGASVGFAAATAFEVMRTRPNTPVTREILERQKKTTGIESSPWYLYTLLLNSEPKE